MGSTSGTRARVSRKPSGLNVERRQARGTSVAPGPDHLRPGCQPAPRRATTNTYRRLNDDCPGRYGYRWDVFRSRATPVARLSRRRWCVVVALVSSLAWIGFALAMWAAPMTGMAAMDDMVDADAAMITVSTFAPAPYAEGAARNWIQGWSDDSASESVALDSSLGSLPLTSMCDTVCASRVNEVCAVAGGLTVIMLLTLLLVPRRDTILGLKARTRTSVLRRQQRHRAPWASPSLIELCVLRV